MHLNQSIHKMCEFACLRFKCQIPLNSQWVNVLRTMKLAHIQKHENARLNHVCFWNIWILQSCIAIASHQRDHLSMFRFVIESHCEYHMIKSKRNMIFASYDYFFRMNMTQNRFSVKNMHVTCNIIPMFGKTVEGLWTK